MREKLQKSEKFDHGWRTFMANGINQASAIMCIANIYNISGNKIMKEHKKFFEIPR